MAWTSTDVSNLESAIITVATTGKTVKFSGGGQSREVTNHNLDEMRSLLAQVRREVAAASSAPKLHHKGKFSRWGS